MCLCASSYSAEIEIAFSVVLFGNIIIALFLIHNYRRQGPPSCEQTCSLFARSLCSHRTVRTTNSANKPRSSNSTEMTVSTSTTESSCESNVLIFLTFVSLKLYIMLSFKAAFIKKLNNVRSLATDSRVWKCWFQLSDVLRVLSSVLWKKHFFATFQVCL